MSRWEYRYRAEGFVCVAHFEGATSEANIRKIIRRWQRDCAEYATEEIALRRIPTDAEKRRVARILATSQGCAVLSIDSLPVGVEGQWTARIRVVEDWSDEIVVFWIAPASGSSPAGARIVSREKIGE